MNDWYTDEVKAALEIVPVEWALDGNKYRIDYACGGWEKSRASVYGDDWRNWGGRDDCEAKALVEKAFREWLEERNITIWKYDRMDTYAFGYVAHPADLGGLKGPVVQREGAGDSYLGALAKAVRHAEKDGF